MISSRKQIRIISLGEIVSPSVQETIKAFTAVIAKHKPGANFQDIQNIIVGVLQQSMNDITDFKLGKLDEKSFTEQRIAALKEATAVELSVAEFDQAWNAMNPKFEQFEGLLKEAVEFNSKPDQQIIFIGFTNPKDIRHLITELEKNKQKYKLDDGRLVEIAGIELHTTYTAKQTKVELIEAIIKRLNTPSPSQSQLANSISNILNLRPIQLSDIKYIRCEHEEIVSTLKADLEKTNQAVEKKTDEFLVDTIIWNKQQQKLSVVLIHPQVTSKLIVVKKL